MWERELVSCINCSKRSPHTHITSHTWHLSLVTSLTGHCSSPRADPEWTEQVMTMCDSGSGSEPSCLWAEHRVTPGHRRQGAPCTLHGHREHHAASIMSFRKQLRLGESIRSSPRDGSPRSYPHWSMNLAFLTQTDTETRPSKNHERRTVLIFYLMIYIFIPKIFLIFLLNLDCIWSDLSLTSAFFHHLQIPILFCSLSLYFSLCSDLCSPRYSVSSAELRICVEMFGKSSSHLLKPSYF